MDDKYIFTSKRLGFRNWSIHDLAYMSAISVDPETMRFFPSTQTQDQTADFIQRMQVQYKQKGYCYFAVDQLDTNDFIGFIGLSDPTFKADFIPCVDIGWRLSKKFWNLGYATEGAKRCIDYGFESVGLKEIVSIAPKINHPSINVMKKIGMYKVLEFEHPLLINDEKLKDCVLYAVSND